MNAIRCWIGPFRAGCRRAYSGFQSKRFSKNCRGRPLLFSKVIELKGYALGKFYGKPNYWKWSCNGRASRADEFGCLYGFSSLVAAGQPQILQLGLR
jgi:hypothetical protein